MRYHFPIKNPYNRLLSAIEIGLVIGLGLFLMFSFVEASGFTDHFDTYDLGDFYDNGVWEVYATESIGIYNPPVDFHSYPQVCSFDPGNKNRAMWREVDPLTDFTLRLYFNMRYNWVRTDGLETIQMKMLDSENNICLLFYFSSYDNNAGLLAFSDSSELIVLNSIPTGWIGVDIQFQDGSPNALYRFRRFGYEWHDWKATGLCPNIKTLMIEDAYPSYPAFTEIRFDTFDTSGISGICGSGDDCIFCDNETDCENNNCGWFEGAFTEYGFSGQCLEIEPFTWEQASTTRNATSFYSGLSVYSTPTQLYLSLTNLGGGIIDLLSSWLSKWEDIFDLSYASEKGALMGLAIPKIRGYLMIFNALFDDLPLAEVFIIYFVIVFAVVILKIVRYIKQLLPFQ